jgi:molybdopterin converting factor small subunit
MATVKIPPVLRNAVGGEKEIAAAGSNVGEVLRAVVEAHPDTSTQIFSGDGQLNRYVNVYLNDEDVRVLDGLDTAVGERDSLVILPAMAGGARSSQSRALTSSPSPPKRWSATAISSSVPDDSR